MISTWYPHDILNMVPKNLRKCPPCLIHMIPTMFVSHIPMSSHEHRRKFHGNHGKRPYHGYHGWCSLIFLITWFFSHHITPKCHYIPWFSPEFAIPQSPLKKKKKQRPGFSARGFSQSLQGPQGPQGVPNQANFMDEAANIWGITGILWDLRGLLLTTMTFNGLISRQSH